MIERDEIEAASSEFEIHTTNVQRDYVFGWLLYAVYNHPYLAGLLILKGGNSFRKGYFPNTRFSSDLDFSTQQALDLERFGAAMAECCDIAQSASGIQFLSERNSMVEAKRAIVGPNVDGKIYKGKVFFKDFYGIESSVEISVRMDVTEFDRLYLPVSSVPLIHPYSDATACSVELRCVAVEEGLASKLKCLLQRRHSHDLYDLVYAAFFDDRVEVDRAAIARVFLQKTIFDRSPGTAKQILLGLPMTFFRAAWDKYIVCPISSRIDFDSAADAYSSFVNSVFATTGAGEFVSSAFFPADLRNLFLDAGAQQKLIKLTYDGYERIVEPYALSYKRAASSGPREYFYVWDRSGGASGTRGIKSLVNPKVTNPEILDEKFTPRFEIELSKSGEVPDKSYFGGGRRASFKSPSVRKTKSQASAYLGGPTRVIQCTYCSKQFKRKGASLTLKPHKDRGGYSCPGRSAYFLRWDN